jgi:predicted nucleotidyltransferase
MSASTLAIPAGELAALCRRYHVRRLSLFGSVLRDDFGPQSDIDVLVEFDAGRTPGFAFFRLEDELSALLGRRVDLNTRASLSRHFRDRVLFDARDVYVAA